MRHLKHLIFLAAVGAMIFIPLLGSVHSNETTEATTTSTVYAARDNTEGPVIRTATVRFGLMNLRRQYRRAGEQDKADAITKILRNREALQMVAEGVCVRFAQEQPPEGPGSWVDEITRLLQWIIDHADEIIALILKIIPLFVQNAPALDSVEGLAASEVPLVLAA